MTCEGRFIVDYFDDKMKIVEDFVSEHYDELKNRKDKYVDKSHIDSDGLDSVNMIRSFLSELPAE